MSTSFDIEHARANMIEQQIRTWNVLDQSVLEILAVVKREEFVPPAYRALAFIDMEIPLNIDGVSTGETMLPPKVEARILQELDLGPNDKVLEIGTGSGYMAALLAQRARHVTTVEIRPELAAFAESNLRRAGIVNVTVMQGDGAQGFPAVVGPNVIVLSGSVPILPDAFLEQLAVGGRLAAFVGTTPAMRAELITKTGARAYETTVLFETDVKPLRNAMAPPKFKF